MTTTQQLIIQAIGTNHDPRLVEAYMRQECGDLSRLTASKFAEEARLASICVELGGVDLAERLLATQRSA